MALPTHTKERRLAVALSGAFVAAAGSAEALHPAAAALPLASLGLGGLLRFSGTSLRVAAFCGALGGGVLAAPPPDCRPSLLGLNKTLWLRLVCAWRALLLESGCVRTEHALLHGAISATFFGIMMHPTRSNRLLLSMSRQFLGRRTFDAVGGDERVAAPSLRDSARTFARAFRGLLPYNTALHLSAFVISAVARGRAPALSGLRKVAAELLQLNVSVASACAVWVAVGAGVRALDCGRALGVALTALCIPLPLAVVWNETVRTNLFFLFGPWAAKYALFGRELPQPLLLATGMLGTEAMLLRPSSNAWLVSVLFGVVSRRLAKRSRFGD